MFTLGFSMAAPAVLFGLASGVAGPGGTTVSPLPVEARAALMIRLAAASDDGTSGDQQFSRLKVGHATCMLRQPAERFALLCLLSHDAVHDCANLFGKIKS